MYAHTPSEIDSSYHKVDLNHRNVTFGMPCVVIYTLLSVSVIRAYGAANSIRVRFMLHHATNIRENLTLGSIQIQFLTRRRKRDKTYLLVRQQLGKGLCFWQLSPAVLLRCS